MPSARVKSYCLICTAVLLVVFQNCHSHKQEGSLHQSSSGTKFQRYFGYYGSALEYGRDYSQEISDHANFNFIESNHPDPDLNVQDRLNKLAKAQSSGMKAIFGLKSTFFQSNLRLFPQQERLKRWNYLSQQLRHYRETIIAFYPIDEPYWNAQKIGYPQHDIHQNLEQVGEIIHTTFPNIPVAMAVAYPMTKENMLLPSSFDWFGFNCYTGYERCGDDVSGYKSVRQYYDTLRNKILTLNNKDGKRRRLILFPPASYPERQPDLHRTLPSMARLYFEEIAAVDSMVVAVMPFTWQDVFEPRTRWIGTRELAHVAEVYRGLASRWLNNFEVAGSFYFVNKDNVACAYKTWTDYVALTGWSESTGVRRLNDFPSDITLKGLCFGKLVPNPGHLPEQYFQVRSQIYYSNGSNAYCSFRSRESFKQQHPEISIETLVSFDSLPKDMSNDGYCDFIRENF